MIKFTCTNPRNISAKKDVVKTFTSQLLITLFPHSTCSYLYYQREPLSGDGSFSEWLRVDTFRCWCRAHEKGVKRHTDASDEKMQINKDACIRNWTDEFTSRDSHRSYRGSQFFFGDSSVTLAQWWRALHLRNLVTRRSPVRFRPKTRQLRFTWMWANRPSSKGSNLLFLVIKAI